MSIAYLEPHVGEWQGWFSEFDADGNPGPQKPSQIIFERVAPQIFRQTNRYRLTGTEQSWVYTNLAAGLKFFADGSFSNGTVQLAPFAEFALEQGFLWADAKVRLVQQWDPQGQITRFTTIREHRREGPVAQPPLWHGEGLEGTWCGTATTYAADEWTPRMTSATITWEQQDMGWHCAVQIDAQHEVTQSIQLGDPSLPTTAITQRLVCFPGQLLTIMPTILPIPTQHRERHFAVHLGWLADPNHYFHCRRRYDQEGTWRDVTIIHSQR